MAIRGHLDYHVPLALQGSRMAAATSSAWCTPDQHVCSAGLAQASTLPLDHGGAQAEGLSPSEAVREMDSACKRRERDRERRKRKREQAAAVAVADGTALHVSGAGCCRGCRGQDRTACEWGWRLQWLSRMGPRCM